MPHADRATDPSGVGPQPLLKVVEQCLERADVQDGDPAPVLVRHPGEDREGRRLCLTASGGRQEQSVLPCEQRLHRGVLEGTQPGPAECGDDVVLQGGVEVIEAGHGQSLSELPRSISSM